MKHERQSTGPPRMTPTHLPIPNIFEHLVATPGCNLWKDVAAGLFPRWLAGRNWMKTCLKLDSSSKSTVPSENNKTRPRLNPKWNQQLKEYKREARRKERKWPGFSNSNMLRLTCGRSRVRFTTEVVTKTFVEVGNLLTKSVFVGLSKESSFILLNTRYKAKNTTNTL